VPELTERRSTSEIYAASASAGGRWRNWSAFRISSSVFCLVDEACSYGRIFA
jgi:hypothetical protein